MPGKRIILTTYGSLGDLHPYIAIAQELQRRGQQPVLATSPDYRDKVESVGVEFFSMGPPMPDEQAMVEMIQRAMDDRGGSEYVIREFAMPALRQGFDDLMQIAGNADLLISHPLTFHTEMVAQRVQVPWVSTMLAPLGFFSAYDPPVLSPAPALAKLRVLGPWFNHQLFRFLKWTTKSWVKPYHAVRAELGLPPAKKNPLFEGQHSPWKVLALFSPLFAEKQPDWPDNTVVTGFPFYEQDREVSLAREIQDFLDAGPPPVIFTLGSSAVQTAGDFYSVSARVARDLSIRAILLVGKDARNRPKETHKDIGVFEYAPYAKILPHAAVIVHQGGVGTTSESMRAGRPMLVVPFAHDQHDNANRVVRLGMARTLSRHKYTEQRLANELQQLLNNNEYATRAQQVGEQIRAEKGLQNIAEAMESVIAQHDVATV